MKLRQQLVVVSLITLVLPWVGVQYIRDMERALREAQLGALRVQAEAVAAHFAANETLASDLSAAHTPPDQPVYYVHTLPTPLVLDGYFDDWLALPYRPQSLPLSADEALVLGRFGNYLYLFIEVRDARRQFFTPGRAIDASDHLVLRIWDGRGEQRTYRIHSAAPGKVQVSGQNGGAALGRRIQGVWQEQGQGYQLELRLPIGSTAGGVSLTVHDGDSAVPTELANNHQPPRARLLTQLPSLRTPLSHFADNGTRWLVFNDSGYLLAESGSLPAADPMPSRWQGFIGRLLRWLATYNAYPDYRAHYAGGYWYDASASARAGGEWRRRGRDLVARVAVPATGAEGRDAAAWIVAERSTHSMSGLVDSAAGRLLVYSVVASAIAGLALIGYASWLSIRVRRLRRATYRAVDASGKIQSHFAASRHPDEVGDLSRSIAHLLQRLRGYTQYLETLASKLSHELRTPLAVIRSSLDNLAAQPLSDLAQVYTERAREGTERLSRILNAMSAATRLEQSLQNSERVHLSLEALLREVVAVYRDVYPDLAVALELDPDQPLTVLAAPELLVQMLDKLMDNAADFCDNRRRITIAARQVQRQVLVEVRNTGPLLGDDWKLQIFDSLVSIRPPSLKSEHLGLGLYVVRMIADYHGGSVSADNDAVSGEVVFSVCLPLEA